MIPKTKGSSKPFLTVALATVVVLAMPIAVSAQNLLINPDFNANFNNWFADNPETVLSHSSSDAFDGSPDTRPSGSLDILNIAWAADDAGAAQCVFVAVAAGSMTGRTVRAGAMVRVFPGQSSPGEAKLWLRAFSTTDCTGTALSSALSSAAPADGASHSVRTSAVSPAGAQSWKIILYVTKSGFGSFVANYDRVELLDAEPQRFDLNADGSTNSADLVIGANRLVGNIGKLPTQ